MLNVIQMAAMFLNKKAGFFYYNGCMCMYILDMIFINILDANNNFLLETYLP